MLFSISCLTWHIVVHPAVGVAGDALVPTLHEIDVTATVPVLQLAEEQHE